MTDPSQKRRERRNLLIALMLVLFVALVYGLTAFDLQSFWGGGE